MKSLRFFIILFFALSFSVAAYSQNYADTPAGGNINEVVKSPDQADQAGDLSDEPGSAGNPLQMAPAYENDNSDQNSAQPVQAPQNNQNMNNNAADDNSNDDNPDANTNDGSGDDNSVKNFEQENNTTAKTDKKPGFTLESQTFKDGDKMPASMIFNSFGCKGDNISPQLSWKNAPEGTKSFAITQFDPDAPTGSGWWHWGVYNIPVTETSLEEGVSGTAKNTLPPGSAEAITDYGTIGYGGACPPVGDKEHHYITTVYALDVEKLDLDPATTTTTLLSFMLHGHTIAKSAMISLYSR